ncbi:MAG TPA: VIT domain-containing protein, partial [Phycisphaerae bacterium]|nr:VIT domain-containing protein [Phycisphaerae bacterium]
LSITAQLSGPLAQPTVTLVFRNNLARQLEGELEFPLPEGAAVVGYALDVPSGSGNLVEGVCIEKERARRIFESEERRGVDPGIVELTRGNNYRTRVHPIPAGGTRTVQLTYASELAGDGTYKLPLDYVGNLKSAKLRIEVLGAKPEDVKIAGLPGITFVQGENTAVAEKSFANVALSGALAITQPVKKDEVYTAVEGGYFMVSAVVPAVPLNFEVQRPQQLLIVWDTSLSRADADRTAEFDALRAMLKAVGTKYIVYATDGHVLKAGDAADAEALVSFLQAVPCDGALNLDGVQQILQTLSMKQTEQRPRGTCILFSDGLVTMGKGLFAPDNMTIYPICSDPKADHAFLKHLAEATGGLYLNLQRMKPAEAADAITSPAMVASFGAASPDTTKIVLQEQYPATPVRVVPGQRITFAGQLHANEVKAQFTLNVLGSVNGPAWTKDITLSTGGKLTGIVPRYWAQQKVASLGTDPAKNEDAIIGLAKQFNLVTPQTSLLVLETVDQYLRYGIAPPKSRADIYQEFTKRADEQDAAKKKAETEKIDHILTLWKARTEWWQTEFKPPTKEELAAAAKKDDLDGQHLREFVPGVAAGSTAPAQTLQPSVPSTRPVRDAVILSDGTAVPRESLANLQRAQETVRQNIDSTQYLTPSGGGSGGYPLLEAKKRSMQEENVATIAIKPWSPDTPYLKALAAAPADSGYDTYLAQRKTFATSPAFYLDCGNVLLEHNERLLGIRVLTSIAQLHLEDAALLRVAAYRLLQAKAYPEAIDLFERAKRLRPDELQSWRDLAIAISEEALARQWQESAMNLPEHERQMSDLLRAMDLYNHVIMNQWDRFDEIEVVALMEANALWARIQRLPGYEYISKQHPIKNPLDSRLIKSLDCDLRIVMTWDADVTDIDLHVLEPTGQEAFYSYNRTLAGGLVSHDFTQGYGPEEYLIHHALP